MFSRLNPNFWDEAILLPQTPGISICHHFWLLHFHNLSLLNESGVGEQCYCECKPYNPSIQAAEGGGSQIPAHATQ